MLLKLLAGTENCVVNHTEELSVQFGEIRLVIEARCSIVFPYALGREELPALSTLLVSATVYCEVNIHSCTTLQRFTVLWKSSNKLINLHP